MSAVPPLSSADRVPARFSSATILTAIPAAPPPIYHDDKPSMAAVNMIETLLPLVCIAHTFTIGTDLTIHHDQYQRKSQWWMLQ